MYRGGLMSLTTKMTRVEQNDDISLKKKSSTRDLTKRPKSKLIWNCCKVMYSNMQIRCPRCCLVCLRCLRSNQEQRKFIDNYYQLEKEVEVKYLLSQLRVLKALIKN